MATIPAASKVGTSCKVSTKKKGKATITATAMDGSGKTAKVKLNVTPFESDKTPAPTESPDPRKYTTIEDFESYDVGTTWTKYTARGKDAGKMTVVQDPENAENKCLKVEMNGTEAAFDFAPAFSVDLSKLKDSDGNSTEGRALKNYSTIRADWRVIGNDSDVTYKKISCYFDQFDAIKTTDAFATSANKTASAHVNLGKNDQGEEESTPVAAGADNETREVRFGLEISMAEGADKETGITLANGNASKENGKYMPTYHTSTWQMEDPSKHYIENSCTLGYKMAESDDINAGFATRNLVFDTARINEADATLLDQSKFDVVMGSTYKGDSQLNTGATTGQTIFYYVDNVALVEDDIPITGFDLSLPEGKEIVYPGGDTTVSVKYTPEDTTQKELIWTSNNPQVTVNIEGKAVVAEDFDFGGQNEVEVVITATSKSNPALAKSVTIKVCQLTLPTEAYVIDIDKMVTEFFDAELSGGVTVEKAKDSEGVDCMKINFTGSNQRAFFKLPETVNLSAYQKCELTGFVPLQMTLDFWDAKTPENIRIYNEKKEQGVTGNDLKPYEWWEMKAAGTVPFFDGSSSNRLPDGTWVAPNDKETISTLLSGIKNSKDVAGNFNEVQYVALGNACNDEDGYSPDGVYYIYSLKLTPKATGELPKYTFTSVPMSESFENATNVLLAAENSTVVEATEESPAQEGTHYMEVAEGDTPAILIDNREGTEDAKYVVSAYVKAKDPSNSAVLQFLASSIFSAEKYESYEGYESVMGLTCLSNKRDLTTAQGWVQVKANITVLAGKISEVSLGNIDGTTFEYLLDNVTLEAK